MPSESVTGTARNDDATAAVQAATVNVVDVALVGCDKHDSPRAVAVAVPVDKRLQPMAIICIRYWINTVFADKQKSPVASGACGFRLKQKSKVVNRTEPNKQP
jgi:hypothetical protein